MHHFAILASGSGSNAEAIMQHFANSTKYKVALLLSNRTQAGALTRARSYGVPTEVLPSAAFDANGEQVLDLLNSYHIDFVVLAGFLRKIPGPVVEKFKGRILNIHPALLPKYGGKGMYGAHVHRAVIEAGDTISGLTIHHVTDAYDEGDILFQASTPVSPADTPDTLSAKVLALEHEHYPRVVEAVLDKLYDRVEN